jgi:AhpC/TSA family
MALLGAAVSVAAFLTYFLVVPRWADLRDSGWPNVLLGGLGALIALSGLLRTRGVLRRSAAALLAILAVVATVFLGLYVGVFSYSLPPPGEAIAAGARAPELSLPDQDGRTRRLSDHAGRPVFLVFFRGHW